MQPLLYTFYGDDFTGSTDALEQLALNGIPAPLFFAPPTPDQLAAFGSVQAFGVAGDSRSRSPEWMTEHLPALFSRIAAFGAPIVHYKVCSTFDSSPTSGSIGRALELGRAALSSPFVPILVGAPHLRRFVLDGRLFAAAPDSHIHRIDRHPMARHPVTPMREPDLRRHLALQTRARIGLVPHSDLDTIAHAAAALQRELHANADAVLFDTVDTASLARIGDLLWHEAQRSRLFAVGSSGLTAALVAAWHDAHLIPAAPANPPIPHASPLLILSGSCSVMTARQIAWASSNGFASIGLDPAALTASPEPNLYAEKILAQTAQLLAEGRSTILYTALGTPTGSPAGAPLGTALGKLLRTLLDRTGIHRAVLCGGDTSSHAAQQLGLTALTCIASLQPGAPLCRAHFPPGTPRPLLELILKGGQVGTEDFFALAQGTS